MANSYYTLRENEVELFALQASSVVVGDGNALFMKRLINQLVNALKRLPVIGCCFGNKADIVVTNQRVLIIEHSKFLCIREDVSVVALSNKVLDGFNSFDYQKAAICCKLFKFSIGICRGMNPASIEFETHNISTVEEASAIIAKFDEIIIR